MLRRRNTGLNALRLAVCLALVLLINLSFASAEKTEGKFDLPDALVGQTFVSSSDSSGTSFRLEEDGGFVLSVWRTEDRDGITLNIYNAKFYGRFDSVSMPDGSAIYEMHFSAIDQAGGMLGDIYYPPSEDLERFAQYLPWEPNSSVRIVPPSGPGGICLLGIPNANGKYIYNEYVPLE